MNLFIKSIYGVIFVAIFAFIAVLLSNLEFIKQYSISPLVVGIILGMIYANSFKNKFSHIFQDGIIFSSKTILRLAIIMYGFRLTFQDLFEVGFSGIFVALCIVFSTFIFGYIVGVKFLKLDKEISILCSAGSSICGAAAIMATQSVVKNESYKSVVAISFIVIFGTIGMFLFPFLYKIGFLNLTENQIGVYLGATLHEVANVVAASSMLGEDIANEAIIVKMIRVIYLVPFLILLSFFLIKTRLQTNVNEKTKIMIPWFAIYFILVIFFNSFDILESKVVSYINLFDTFLLTMAMSALGMESSFDKFKAVGMKPFYLSSILFIWLFIVGYIFVNIMVK